MTELTEAPIAASQADDDSARLDAELAFDALVQRWARSAARHRQAPPVRVAPLSWQRVLALALVLALHLGLLLWLSVPPSASDAFVVAPRTTPLDRLQVVFVDPVVPPAATVPGLRWLPSTAPAPVAETDVTPPPPPPAEPAPRPLSLFNADGSVALPEGSVSPGADSDQRMFDYMTPGLTEADKAFERKPNVTYEETRFEKDWKPVRSIGGELLNTVIEATTVQNRHGTIRCSLLIPACAWGSTREAVELDDPDTLNPEEAAQCDALWADIEAATDQAAWLKLRARYDAECRKPLARERLPAAPR